jgi:hypothetical protein
MLYICPICNPCPLYVKYLAPEIAAEGNIFNVLSLDLSPTHSVLVIPVGALTYLRYKCTKSNSQPTPQIHLHHGGADHCSAAADGAEGDPPADDEDGHPVSVHLFWPSGLHHEYSSEAYC